MGTLEMTKENHDETIAGDGIVLIDFWAGWCGPCLQFAPIFERQSDKHTDVTFAKVDTEAERELALRYQVSSIPTLVIYRDGIPVFSQPGALPEPMLEDLIQQTRGLDMQSVRTQYAAQVAGQGS